MKLTLLACILFGSKSLAFGSVTSRSDYSNSIQSLEQGWGGWSSWKFCNHGQYGTGFQLLVESNQGGGDDTGANAFHLICEDGEYINAGNDAPWGGDNYIQGCGLDSAGSAVLIKGFASKVEGNQGGGDDTALNAIRAYCTNSAEIVANIGGYGQWAGSASMCPSGTAVCGFAQSVEGQQGRGDDTALNAVRLACCKTTKAYSDATGYWESIIRGNGGLEFSYEATVGITHYNENSWSESNTEALETALSASMSFTYAGVGGEVSLSLTQSVSSTITSSSLSSVTKTIEQTQTMKCASGYKALYQYVTSVKESAINIDSNIFEIHSEDFWCSASGLPPRCPYLYCADEDCQTCTETISAS